MNLKKSENTLVFVLVLFAISLLSASLIAFVHVVTKPKIAHIKKQILLDSAKLVMPIGDFDISYDEDTKIFTATNNDGTTNTKAFITKNSQGYSGIIAILMGVNTSCKITGFKIMESKETPGLGTKASEPEFKNQFKNKGFDFNFKVKKDGGDVDAITAATITSRAVSAALADGLKYAKDQGFCTSIKDKNKQEVE